MGIERLIRDPLVHFVAVGGLLFAAQVIVGRPEPGDPIGAPIVISAEFVDGLVDDFEQRTGSRPRDAEKEALVDEFVDEEVLYREALRLGLDRGDVIVRRRLVQKMRFLAEDRLAADEASEDALRDYLATHRDRYAEPRKVKISHAFFAEGARATARAESALLAIRGRRMSPRDAIRLGDSFLSGQELGFRTEDELSREFGNDVARAAIDASAGTWVGPLRSAHGLHLVYIEGVMPMKEPSLSDARVRDRARRDLEVARRKEMNRKLLDELRMKYDIREDASGRRVAIRGGKP